jgi:DNA repair exonuclease SbcCD ATPase subunit
LEEAVKTKKEIDDEILRLQNTLHSLDKAEKEYHQLLEQKENIIKAGTSRFAAKVFEISEQEGRMKAYLNEVEEAITAGNYAKSALEDARSSLEKAEGWGTWDMFGGGAVTGIMKHQHIDQAEALLHKAQTNIRQFQKELLDIQEQAHLKVEISDMLKFADFFFDGFIADFMVQGKIQKSLEQIRLQTNKVTEILMNLNEQFEKKRKQLETIQKEKHDLIVSL